MPLMIVTKLLYLYGSVQGPLASGTSWVVTVPGITSIHASITAQIGPPRTSMSCRRSSAFVMTQALPPGASGCSRVRVVVAPISKSATSKFKREILSATRRRLRTRLLRGRRRTRVKQAQNGWRRAAVAPGPRASNTLAPGGKSVHGFPAHTLLSALPLCEVGAARAARWRILLFHVRIGPQKLNQYEFRLAPADERVWNCHVYNKETQGKPIRGTTTKPTRLRCCLDHEFLDLATFSGFAMPGRSGSRAETPTDCCPRLSGPFPSALPSRFSPRAPAS